MFNDRDYREFHPFRRMGVFDFRKGPSLYRTAEGGFLCFYRFITIDSVLINHGKQATLIHIRQFYQTFRFDVDVTRVDPFNVLGPPDETLQNGMNGNIVRASDVFTSPEQLLESGSTEPIDRSADTVTCLDGLNQTCRYKAVNVTTSDGSGVNYFLKLVR